MAENTDNKEKQPQLMSRRSFLQKSALMGAAFLAASSVIPQGNGSEKTQQSQ